MKKHFSKKTYFRVIAEVLFLGVFAFLVYLNKVQMWLPVFAAGIVFSLVFSRFYCGWMCQMNTLFRPINWIYGKFGIKRLKTPEFFKYKAVRYIVLVLMLGSMVMIMRLKLKINLLLYVTIASVAVTLIFEESFWHSHVCPYGAILSLPSRPSKYSVKIDEENCTSCGLCQMVCPSEAIETLNTKKKKNYKEQLSYLF